MEFQNAIENEFHGFDKFGYLALENFCKSFFKELVQTLMTCNVKSCLSGSKEFNCIDDKILEFFLTSFKFQ